MTFLLNTAEKKKLTANVISIALNSNYSKLCFLFWILFHPIIV